jgi:ketosteroid isomerase-like protein
MQPAEPNEVYDLFTRYFSAKAIDLLMTLYEEDAVLLPSDGQQVKGKAAVREALNGLLAIDGTFSMEQPMVLESGDIALLMAKWSLEGTSPDGKAVDIEGHTADVVRRQSDGSWLIVIDNPFGTANAG